MVSLLLPVIYLAFISLGLPDSLLGSAWPVMYQELGTSVSAAGIISMIISAGTIVSSLNSDRLNTRFGTGKVTAVSVLTTAVALFGFSISHSFWALCLWGIPYGLGAGSVDAALNNYVALHYKARHMSWLHCMWGVGCSTGPVVMSWAISHLNWNKGYLIISIFQIVLTLVLFLSLPLWQKPAGAAEEDTSVPAERSFSSLIRVPGVKEVLICFFCYCAVESTAGMWAASYCTLFRGIDAQRAASWASLFYVGITVGRFLSGFIAMKLNDHQMINLGFVLVALGILPILLPLGSAALVTGLVTVGLGCAPIYPSVIHETPLNFGRNLSMALTGVQMAAAYVGNVVFPPLFGLLAQYISISLYPWYLLAALVLMAVMSRALHRKTAAKRAANGY